MIVDSSAIIAILHREDGSEGLRWRLAEEEEARISAANWLEAAIIIDARGDAEARADFDAFFPKFDIAIEPVTPQLAAEARRAYRDWGKGNHPAKLNLGDCFAYALARLRREPLLFKGEDFARTDIEPALKTR